MNISLKILITLIFPIISTIVLFVFKKPVRSYIISALLFIMSLLIFGLSRVEFVSLLEDIIFFPFEFSVGNSYASTVRFALALTGSVIFLFNAGKKSFIFHLFSIWAISSALIITLAENFLTLFLFWELLSLTTAGIIFISNNQNSYKKGGIYLLAHLSGGLLLLTGILINYEATGSLSLAIPEAGQIFFVLAVGIKTAFIPFNFWLINGYPAASWQGTVLLSALSTKAGVYAVARILEPSLAIAYMGGFMAIYGVILALMQKKMRPLLSYHIISQVGYMVAGVGLGLSLSVDGGLLHLLNHMLYKGLLLMTAGAVIYATGTEKMKKLGGFWTRVPFTTMAALTGSLAISGIPPFNGFISKTLLKYGTGEERYLSILLLIAGVGTVMSFSKFMYFGFFRKNNGEDRVTEIKMVPWSLRIPMLITSLFIIIMGVYPSILGRLAPYQSDVFIYSFSSVREALIIGFTGIILFLILRPFLNPKRIILPHKIINRFNIYIEYGIKYFIRLIKKLSSTEEMTVNCVTCFWMFLFSFSFIISVFLMYMFLFY